MALLTADGYLLIPRKVCRNITPTKKKIREYKHRSIFKQLDVARLVYLRQQ